MMFLYEKNHHNPKEAYTRQNVTSPLPPSITCIEKITYCIASCYGNWISLTIIVHISLLFYCQIPNCRYPDKLAWQLELTRKDIRSNEAYYKLHNFLITETENGSISRQETVSMIPPLLLDVKSHHKASFIICR